LRQLLNYLRLVRARLAMLVYRGSATEPENKIFDSLGILVVSEGDLLRWSDKDLILQLSKLRNQVVHSS
jgi:hypothetical protein